MEPLDLSNMDKKSAKEYVAALITTLKQTTAKRKEVEKEVELWEGRVTLAEEKERPDLRAQAAGLLEEKKDELHRLRSEEAAFKDELNSAKSQLRMIQNQPEFTIDADRLLAELEMVVGEVDETGDHFREFEAEQALEKLRKEMAPDNGKNES